MNKSMTSFNYKMTIPIYPNESAYKEETELGPVGMALNGVPIYNDYEGGGVLQEMLGALLMLLEATPGQEKITIIIAKVPILL